jgi:hypothetical protein
MSTFGGWGLKSTVKYATTIQASWKNVNFLGWSSKNNSNTREKMVVEIL